MPDAHRSNPQLGDRLQQELAARGIGVRQLAERVQKIVGGEKVRGATYPGVRALVQGQIKSPRREILAAVAEVLAVREEWLTTGSGPRDAVAAAAESHVAAAITTKGKAGADAEFNGPEPSPYSEAERVLGEELPGLLEVVPTFIRSPLLEVWYRLVSARMQREHPTAPFWPPTPAIADSAARDLAASLVVPLHRLDPDGQAFPLGRGSAPGYFLAMAQALLAAIPDPLTQPLPPPTDEALAAYLDNLSPSTPTTEETDG